MIVLRLGCIGQDGAIEITANEVTKDDGYIEEEDISEVSCPEVQGNAEVVEGIGNTVGKTAHNEEGHTEEQREVLALTGEGDGSGHDEATTDGKHATAQGAYGQTPLQHALGRLLQGHRRTAGDESHCQTTDDVAHEDEKQLADFTTSDKAGCAGVEFERIMHYREQTKGEEHRTNDALLCEVSKAGDADAHAGEESGTKKVKHI